MKSKLVELICRQCMLHTYRKSETLILSDFETQAREDLLNNTYFTMRCPNCGNPIEFIHPLAYVDTKHHFILLIKAKKDFNENDVNLYEEDQRSRKRFLSDPTMIGEKIRIFEDDMDDRIIEILKVKLKSKYTPMHPECRVHYHDFDRATNTIWFVLRTQEEPQYIAVVGDSYCAIKKQLTNTLPATFCFIDEAWAQAFLKEKSSVAM